MGHIMRTVPDREVEYVDFPIYHQELESALDFTASDLDANRTGKLSSSQRALLLKSDAKRVAIAAASVVIAVVLLVVAIRIGITSGLSLRILLLVGIALVVAGVLAMYSFRLWEDMRRGAVSMVEGMVTPSDKEVHVSGPNGPGATFLQFYWVVDQQRFWVPGKAYGVVARARHRVYYLPLTRRIMSADPVSGGAA
jgi:hypothetical protein